ncbi:MAG: hypothetical protein AAFO69_13610 [Bacteroidota bacterium]
MLKKLNTITGASDVSKEEQKNVNGGMLRKGIPMCSESCPSATSAGPCGPPHCPGWCDGNGGWVNY